MKGFNFDEFKSQGLHIRALGSKFERLFNSYYIPRPFLPLLFDYPNKIPTGLQIIKFCLPPAPSWFLVYLTIRP
jgi:hypothetical protein